MSRTSDGCKFFTCQKENFHLGVNIMVDDKKRKYEIFDLKIDKPMRFLLIKLYFTTPLANFNFFF